MIPVPSYQALWFLSWLQGRDVHMSREFFVSEELRELARQFLETGSYWDASLAGVMAVFQQCPMIGEHDIAAQMDHFADCGRCIEMIARDTPSWLSSAPAGDVGGLQRDEDPESRNLQPLLSGFVEWARDSSLVSHLRSWRQQAHFEWKGSPAAFADLMRAIGRQLRESFGRYLSEVRQRQADLIETYESWRRDRGASAQEPPEEYLEFDEYAQPLGPDERLEQAAERLAHSLGQLFQSVCRLRPCAMSPLTRDLPVDPVQALEFMNWLCQHEPGLMSPGSIPSRELEGLALQFCEERGYSNGRSFSKEARKWFSGAGSQRIVYRLARLLRRDKRPTLPNGRPLSYNPLDRYGEVRFHAMFLFMSAGDFPGFIEAHWRDLHHLTGDDLDIYYSQKDLSERTSGYEVANELRTLNLRVDALPALLLWEDRLEAGTTIPLHGLDHAEILEVVKAVVQAISDKCVLDDVTCRGVTRAEELRNLQGHAVVVQSGATLIINNGGVMGDVYDNKGVVGAMGRKAVAHDNVFLQEAREALAHVALTSESAAVVAELAEALVASDIPGLRLAQRKKGARYLAALADAAKKGSAQEKPLAGWKKWLSSTGKAAQQVLSVMADAAIVAPPLARLLGLPV
jgi:hypothetical protein